MPLQASTILTNPLLTRRQFRKETPLNHSPFPTTRSRTSSDWLELSVTHVMPRFGKRKCQKCAMTESSSTKKWQKKWSIPWIPTVYLSSYVPSKVTLEEQVVDPALQDSIEIPLGWTEYLFHVGCSRTMHSIFQAGLIAGGKDAKEGQQTVFFTALDPTGDEIDEEYEDLTKPRKVHHRM